MMGATKSGVNMIGLILREGRLGIADQIFWS